MLQLGKRRLLGRACWQLAMKRQNKHLWNRTEKRRERLKSVCTSASASLRGSGRHRPLPPFITRRKYVNRLGAWNVRGINDATKREEVVNIFKKGKGEVSWLRVNFIIAGVQEMERAREGVAVLLNDVWHSAMVKFGCVSSIISGLNSSFKGLKIVWW